MANPFYQSGPERANRVRALFAAIARRYDLINDLQSCGLHRRWKRQLVGLARLGPGQRALDVCCGTGDIAFALAGAGAEVVGLDFSPEMLAVAAERLEARRARGQVPRPPAIQFVRGDALELPFPDARFDVVTIGYGLRNLADFARGIGEMRRVLRPGGRLLVLDFGMPGNPVVRALYLAYLQLAVPLYGWVFAGSPAAYAYILESLRHYPGQAGVADLMRRQGFAHVEVVNRLGGAMAIHRAERPALLPPVGGRRAGL